MRIFGDKGKRGLHNQEEIINVTKEIGKEDRKCVVGGRGRYDQFFTYHRTRTKFCSCTTDLFQYRHGDRKSNLRKNNGETPASKKTQDVVVLKASRHRIVILNHSILSKD